MRPILFALALAACQPKTTSPTGDVVARIDGEAITEKQLVDEVKGRLQMAEAEYKEKVHDLRNDALDSMIDDRLLERKAKTMGLTTDALLEREVSQRVQVPSEAELRALYQQAKDAGRELPPFDDIKQDIAKFIHDRKAEQALRELRDKLRAEARIEKLLPALDLPRVEVDATGPTKGPADAPITVVEFSDYECPYCGRVEPTVRRMLEAYPGKIRLVYKDFPLPGHENAPKAAEAAHCAGEQGKYWQMHGKLFDNQTALTPTHLKAYARDIGLDGARFDGCLDSGATTKTVEASTAAGNSVGIHATPSFFINGRPLSGALPFETFQEVIDAELKKTK